LSFRSAAKESAAVVALAFLVFHSRRESAVALLFASTTKNLVILERSEGPLYFAVAVAVALAFLSSIPKGTSFPLLFLLSPEPWPLRFTVTVKTHRKTRPQHRKTAPREPSPSPSKPPSLLAISP